MEERAPDDANDAKEPNKMTLGGILGAVFVLVVLLAMPVVVSIWSTATERYPALFFIERQALWDHGRYGVKMTFACTWIYILTAMVIPFAVGHTIVDRIRPPKEPPPSPGDPSWRELERHRRPLYIVYAMAPAGAAALLLYVLVERPEAFMPVSFLGTLSFVAVPIALFAALALFINAVGRVDVFRGSVDAIETDVDPVGKRPPVHKLKSGDKMWMITAESAERLTTGAEIRIEHPPFASRVLALSVKATTPYRS
jgi:hypothetical protein